MTLTNFLCSRIVSCFKVFRHAAPWQQCSLYFIQKITNVPCMWQTRTYMTNSYKQNSFTHQRKRLCLFKKFLMASFIRKIFSFLFETHLHNRVELKTAGSSHNELHTVLRKWYMNGSSFFCGQQMSGSRNNKVSQETFWV